MKKTQVKGDVRIIFYQKMKGGRLFYACFNTAFISKSMLQVIITDYQLLPFMDLTEKLLIISYERP